MRILFVDDETRVLEALERALFDLPPDWEVEALSSGAEALARLAEAPFDVIVSDMRMPAMSGAELLQQVSSAYPAMVRIILSGYTGEEQALGVTPVAHQWLSKPCSAQAVMATVARVQALRDTVGAEIRTAAGGMARLASVPRLYQQLQQVLMNPHGTTEMIVEVVEQDPAMCAKAMQLASSSFFSRGGNAPDVRTAIGRIGVRILQALALEVGVFGASSTALRFDDVVTLQRSGMRRALVARSLAPMALRDPSFLAALLADVGVQVNAGLMPEAVRSAMKRVAAGASLTDAEASESLPPHPLSGAYLLGLWGLPEPIVDAVARHHMGRQGQTCPASVADVVHCASALVEGCEPDAGSVEALGGAPWLERARVETRVFTL
jgi:HD-like signal output (HDOD) protein